MRSTEEITDIPLTRFRREKKYGICSGTVRQTREIRTTTHSSIRAAADLAEPISRPISPDSMSGSISTEKWSVIRTACPDSLQTDEVHLPVFTRSYIRTLTRISRDRCWQTASTPIFLMWIIGCLSITDAGSMTPAGVQALAERSINTMDPMDVSTCLRPLLRRSTIM